MSGRFPIFLLFASDSNVPLQSNDVKGPMGSPGEQ